MMSNTIKLSAFYVTLLVSIARPTMAQVPALQTSPPPQADAAAAQSLNNFRSFVTTSQNHLAIGLDAPGGVETSTIGTPLVDYVVGLTQLQEWNGEQPMKILRPTGQYIYPINIGGLAKSSVTIAKIKEEWVTAVFGSTNEAQARDAITNKIQAPGSNKSDLVQVRIPALRASFLAFDTPSGMQFTSLTTRPELSLEAGATEAAASVLKRLQPKAKSIDPNVPN